MQKIILIAGPSGAGKTTISDYLSQQYHIQRVITHTTRPKRAGEKSGVAYYFEDEVSFSRLHLFESVKYGDYHYGSSQEGLRKAWAKGDLVSLIVDIEGARSYIKALGPQVYFLYVTSPVAELAERMRLRGDDPDKIKQRLTGHELNRLPEDLKPYAHVLVNEDLTQTKQALDQLMLQLMEQK